MSGASAMRNAVKRITHKERAQPASRKKFGLLEKHKDYVERAKDYQKKKKNIKILKEKAANKNPDEFYFGMNSSKVVNGIHKKNENKSLSVGDVSLLKTQDLGYIIHKKGVEDQKIEKLRSTLHFIGKVEPKKHTIFVDSAEDVEHFDPAAHFDTVPELVDRVFNRPKISTLEKEAASSTKRPKSKKDLSVAKYTELELRAARKLKLQSAMENLQTQRNLMMGKGSKRKIVVNTDSDGNACKEKVMYKWKRQRAR